MLAAIPQASGLKVTATSIPPGARGGDVLSVALIAQDTTGVLKPLDQAGKRGLAESLLNAAGAAWPKAAVSLVIQADPTNGGTQVVGSRPPGGPTTIVIS